MTISKSVHKSVVYDRIMFTEDDMENFANFYYKINIHMHSKSASAYCSALLNYRPYFIIYFLVTIFYYSFDYGFS